MSLCAGFHGLWVVFAPAEEQCVVISGSSRRKSLNDRKLLALTQPARTSVCFCSSVLHHDWMLRTLLLQVMVVRLSPHVVVTPDSPC